MRTLVWVVFLSCCSTWAMAQQEVSTSAANATRPNIVWIFVDDMSANFSCYGESTIQTPRVDGMAAAGTRFTRAFVTAPVCSPCRSALITGCYQTSIGAHHHRSGRGKEKIHLPAGIEPVPALFQRAGYYTSNSGPPGSRKPGLGKTDYNFEWDPSIYNGADWSGRETGQPFFAQFQLLGGKYRGNVSDGRWSARVQNELGSTTAAESVLLPPYYPRDPVLLNDWAEYLDTVRYTDYEVGLILDRLRDEGVLEQTVVFFLTDHGISHARGKQFLYEEGIHVPLVIQGPGIAAGEMRVDMVEHIDLAPTSLALAGIEIPTWMQGRNILAKDYVARDAVFAARDRCDETVDQIRCVRTDRYKYIRNGYPHRPHLQANAYKDSKTIVRRLREMHTAGTLDPLVERLLFAPERPSEELYDLFADPNELNNLAGDPGHGPVLRGLRARLTAWQEETNDLGRAPEGEAMFDSDMEVYFNDLRRAPDQIQSLRTNIEQHKAWSRAGR